MKKVLLSLIALTFSINTFAIEFGAILSDSTAFNFYDDNKKILNQSETLTPSLKIPFGKTAYFSAEASVQHKLDATFDDENKTENAIIIDSQLFKFYKIAKFENAKALEFSFGRMITTDSTGLILNQSVDGAFIKYSSPAFELSTYGMYTGFQNYKNTKNISSMGFAVTVKDEKDIYNFSAPYITAVLNANFPYLIANQSLFVEAMGIFPTDGPSSLEDKDNEENRFYATFGMTGALTSSIFSDITATFLTNNFDELSILTKASATYFAPVKNATVGINAVYASGKNGKLCPFTQFTKTSACLDATERYYIGIFKAGLNTSILPTKQIYLSLGANILIDVLDEDDTGYYGTQVSFMSKFQIFSDVQLTFGLNSFIADEKANNRTELALGATIAF